MKAFIMLFLSLFLVAGCQLTHVEGEVDDVNVKVTSKDGDKSDKKDKSEGDFCPPGQAKKGRC
ncbi:hypothetical protein LRP49_01695 [Enterovibrio sp. ZSDZ35]|uniref:Lipoprotein n=1 Tax=Enterovibrio qingdaonensis TaxID=2899818 RepID=A0ABT5QGQ6_9GAMM|nr:hypothetical protein [Enterovibrio sp. ZSDZ35]MDD1779898.1 hypothetical protein [Enterovibrio sp. ZSDZ35]